MKFLLVPILAVFIDIIYLQVSVINRVANILNTMLTLSSRGSFAYFLSNVVTVIYFLPKSAGISPQTLVSHFIIVVL